MSKYINGWYSPVLLTDNMYKYLIYLSNIYNPDILHPLVYDKNTGRCIYPKEYVNQLISLLRVLPQQLKSKKPIIYNETELTVFLFSPIIIGKCITIGQITNKLVRESAGWFYTEYYDLSIKQIEEYVLFVENESKYLEDLRIYFKDNTNITLPSITTFSIPSIPTTQEISVPEHPIPQINRLEDISDELCLTSNRFQDLLEKYNNMSDEKFQKIIWREIGYIHMTRMEYTKYKFFF